MSCVVESIWISGDESLSVQLGGLWHIGGLCLQFSSRPLLSIGEYPDSRQRSSIIDHRQHLRPLANRSPLTFPFFRRSIWEHIPVVCTARWSLLDPDRSVGFFDNVVGDFGVEYAISGCNEPGEISVKCSWSGCPGGNSVRCTWTSDEVWTNVIPQSIWWSICEDCDGMMVRTGASGSVEALCCLWYHMNCGNKETFNYNSAISASTSAINVL